MGSDEMDPGLVSGIYISIHAPRMGSDRISCATRKHAIYFNPRSPHGERPRRNEMKEKAMRISIHAPRMGSDNGKEKRK